MQGIFRELLSGGMSGTLDAIGSQANSMYPRGMFGVPANLGSYGGVLSGQMMNAPGLSALLQNFQQQMVDKYPQVISRDQSVEVAYSASGAAEVRRGSASTGSAIPRCPNSWCSDPTSTTATAVSRCSWRRIRR